ncbi:response regulator [Chryseobacterium sp. 1B4]
MDVQMPVMDGIEATKQIRLLPEYAGVPIIGVTAGNVLGEKEKCMDSGMNDFLPKPLRQADLLAILEKYILNENDIPSEESSDKEKYFDIKLLNEHMGDDDEDFKKIFLNLVIQELTQAEENIRKSTAEKDSTALKMILHKLKGTAGTAGLIKLTERTADWEKKTEPGMDFTSMEKEIIREITTGLQFIKNLIQ